MNLYFFCSIVCLSEMVSFKNLVISIATFLSAFFSVFAAVIGVFWFVGTASRIFPNFLATGFSALAVIFFIGLFAIPCLFFFLCKKFNGEKWLFLIDLLWLVFLPLAFFAIFLSFAGTIVS